MNRSLRDLVFTFDDAFPAAACRALVDTFERRTDLHQRNGAGVQAGLEDSAWTELDLARLGEDRFPRLVAQQMRMYFERYDAAARLTLPISPLRRASELIVKRYRPGTGERFQFHFDALGAVSNRYLVFLWYLNDVTAGGQTVFPDLDLRIEARAGRLLMFPPYWMFQHAGLPPESGDKYILSTYAVY